MDVHSLPRIAHALAAARPEVTPDAEVRWRAAVAVVLRDLGAGTEVLVIRRAVRAGDRWSGHAALPGGKAEPDDPSIEATAVRETLEEVGIDLTSARSLGRLSDHPRGRMRRWARWSVTPVLFELQGDPKFHLDTREVAVARWVPLAALGDRRHAGVLFHWWRPIWRVPIGLPMLAPRWRYNDLSIWGLTRSILEDVLSLGAS